MLKRLLQSEKQSIDYFFDHLDARKAEAIIDELHACQGVIILTGVGKSGLVAKKIAVTLISTGSRALYISPTNALHGDLGMVNSQDIFVMLSKSGESDELLHLVPFMRNKGAKIVAIVSNPKSRLAVASDEVLHLPLEKELCPFDLVPTVSTTIQMIFGDLLAVSLMSKKNFSLDQYALNHPAGKIGRSITLRVKDLMLSGENVPTCKGDDKLVDILVELSDKKCGCVLIVDEAQKLQGIFTDGDLRRALQSKGSEALDTPMQSLMTYSARWIAPDELAAKAVHLMESDQKRPITVLPVLEEGEKVVGLIKMHDIIQSGL